MLSYRNCHSDYTFFLLIFIRVVTCNKLGNRFLHFSKKTFEPPAFSKIKRIVIVILTLLVAGSKIYIKWQGVFATPPLLNTRNHCEKSRNLGVFGGHFGVLRADLR